MNAKARRIAGLVAALWRFSHACHCRIDGDGEHRVSRPARLWFRNRAHTRYGSKSFESGHQSKIYGKSNRQDFLPIFVALISMQTLAIYLRSVVVTVRVIKPQWPRETDDRSRDVVHAAFDILARAGAGAPAQGQ